jgi:Phage integrase family
MRKGEIASLRWEDLDGDLLTLRGENAKSGGARTIPCEGELSELLARRRERRPVKVGGTVMLCDLIFHRQGKPIREFRKAWRTACRMAHIPGRLFHDLRRSAVRDLVRSGVSQNVAMSISGHRSLSMFERYNITDERDQRQALQQVQQYRKDQHSQMDLGRVAGTKRLTKPPLASSGQLTAASRTLPWLASGWGCRGRRLSRGRKNLDGLATAAARLCAPTQQTVGRNAGGRAKSQSSNPPSQDCVPDKRC